MKDGLVGLLTDVEGDLLEPVDRFRDLVDADNHAAGLDLDTASSESHQFVKRRWKGERTNRINSSSRSSLLGWFSPIPGSFAFTGLVGSSSPAAARTELRYDSCFAFSSSWNREGRP